MGRLILWVSWISLHMIKMRHKHSKVTWPKSLIICSKSWHRNLRRSKSLVLALYKMSSDRVSTHVTFSSVWRMLRNKGRGEWTLSWLMAAVARFFFRFLNGTIALKSHTIAAIHGTVWNVVEMNLCFGSKMEILG